MMNCRLRILLAAVLAAGTWQGAGPVALAQNFADMEEQSVADEQTQAPQAAEGAQPAEVVHIDPVSDENLKAVVDMTKESALTADEAERYTLGPTDVIEVTIMRHPEVSGQYEVNSEGKIQYGFVGDVVVLDLTKEQVSQSIKERLSEYIVNPEVTVTIVGYNSKVVYVVGEVGQPGKIFMRGNTITVREALMQAGLPLLSGITKKSRLITPSEGGNMVKKEVDVYSLLYEGDLRENLIMNPGDILYIPPTFLTKTMRAIAPVTTPIRDASGGARAASGTGF
ncbi:MAG: polysaccharide biosynthesis/export family protein [Candidatus Omnitrophota bacterium]|nr:polysaccharide biosynthesis/export family protein [Candidatus Omnitrophota bacterium]MDZ4241792.1 polysaccharide biosynthesis/export family protein [Candidatus Omnitrophota bacterium]